MTDTVEKPPDINQILHHADRIISTLEKQNVLSDDLPPLEIVREMIKYETFLRLSEPIQELFDSYRTDDNAITMVLDLIQQHVVERFGYRHVNALRTAMSRFPDDPIIKEAFYVKHNKITQGLVNQGQCAIDVKLFTLNGQSTTLFSYITAEQPLRINQLFRSHAPVMRLLTIYIAEAHARDQWPAGKTISCVDQPKTLEQRLENARQFKVKFNYEMPMVVDSMDNTFHRTYGSWPFRFYVIHDGKLVFKAEPGETTYAYDWDELDTWLNDFCREKTRHTS
ncbi:unnamed protein product [Rotaria magnacalcarata]|uniref:Iodothyronine deiodinase n=2 Tax=Rotaria magnacalcarata TaxID=392030 RepID=A0A816VAN0_9BILA|nr:unnamed protein product [Rotaria magnacalcarata]CAF2148322.1 unnamed protein product [Rotaria magnacalcarata]